jgi:hypothetical protein
LPPCREHVWGEHPEYESIKEELRSLITREAFSGRYVVQDFKTIRENMGILPYNYGKIACKLEKTLQRWAKLFPKPRFADIYLPRQEVLLPKLHPSTTRKATPRRKKRLSQRKCYSGRRFWTDEEKRAILEGIEIYGKSQWREIKNHFKKELADRTSCQIKDCHRTLVKHGKVLPVSTDIDHFC